MKFSFFAIVAFAVVLIFPSVLQAQTSGSQNTYVKEINYKLEQPFGGEATITSLSQYIQTIYKFALGIVGIIAVVLIMFGGLRWVAAAGNESTIGEAKEMIVSAVTGLVIALLSYIILLTISPQLVQLRFSTPKIPLPRGNYIWKLEWCSVAPFKGNQCSPGLGGSDVSCEDVTCGDTGSYNGGLCRGAVCDDAPGKPGCYHDAVNPAGAASCQLQTCGKWVDACYKKYRGDDQQADYRKCLCNYYQGQVMPLMGVSSGKSPSSYTTEELVQFSSFCGEKSSQDELVSKITNDVNDTSKDYYTFKYSAAVVPNYGYDCNFGCRYIESSTESSFIGIVSANRTVECRAL